MLRQPWKRESGRKADPGEPGAHEKAGRGTPPTKGHRLRWRRNRDSASVFGRVTCCCETCYSITDTTGARHPGEGVLLAHSGHAARWHRRAHRRKQEAEPAMENWMYVERSRREAYERRDVADRRAEHRRDTVRRTTLMEVSPQRRELSDRRMNDRRNGTDRRSSEERRHGARRAPRRRPT